MTQHQADRLMKDLSNLIDKRPIDPSTTLNHIMYVAGQKDLLNHLQALLNIMTGVKDV